MAEKVINIDSSALTRVVGQLSEFPNEIKPALARAINKTMDSTVTQIKKEVSAEYTIKQKDVAKAIVRQKAKPTNLSSAAIASGGQVSLAKFKHTPNDPPPKQIYRQPVRVQVKKKGGRKVVVNGIGNKGFIQKIHGSNMIFTRRGKARLPIDKHFSLSVPQMISDKNDSKGSIQRIKKRTEEMLNKKVEQEINYRLNKVKGGK